jgi:5-methylcytosine-specific restriction protein A
MPQKLTSLKPRISTQLVAKVQTLTPSAGTVQRKRGYAGVIDRSRIRARDMGLCQECVRQGTPGPGWLVDHIVALWEGGSDEDENKQTLCKRHHDEKSAEEAARRASGG